MEKVYVPKNPHEKAMQRALIQYKNPENRSLVEEALKKGGREDLIGFGPKCLLRPLRHTDGKKSYGNSALKSGTEKKAQNKGKKRTIRNVHKKKSSKK